MFIATQHRAAINSKSLNVPILKLSDNSDKSIQSEHNLKKKMDKTGAN